MLHTLKVLFPLYMAALFVSACIGGGTVNIPQDHYYQLPPVSDSQPLVEPALSGSLSINNLFTSGMLHERAVLFVSEKAPLEINPYHYHHWVNAPSSLIQRHMLSYLHKKNLAKKHQRYRSDAQTDYTINGELLHFERQLNSSSIKVHVEIELALRDNRQNKELLRQTYVQVMPAAGKDMAQTISAFGSALEQIYAQFIRDIRSENSPQ
ncbi:MAG: ABC-type transport auxiliary lipoprotein family protein [Gammaproteobacteria bacterium]|nr:ABC-type transport auxiliary lipoprotein family protein [Gammaproteobacteria bacterium]